MICGPCKHGTHDCMNAECECPDCNEDAPVVIWEEPPGGRGRRTSGPPITNEQIAALKGRPGAWARIKRFDRPGSAASAAGRVKKGIYPDLNPDQWEFAVRRENTGSVLYMRFIGEP